MIQYLKRSLTLGDNSEELLSEESGGLPFLCYFDESRLFTGNHIPWHWHDRIELNYVEEGTFRFHSPDVEFEAGPGEVVFINRNIMHAYDFPAPVLPNNAACRWKNLFPSRKAFADSSIV